MWENERRRRTKLKSRPIGGEDEGAGLLSLIRKKVFFGERGGKGNNLMSVLFWRFLKGSPIPQILRIIITSGK